MSSILEALKKLEDEKSAHLRGAGNIAGKVVRSGRRPKQRPVWALPAGMAIAAAVAALATYLLTGVNPAGNRPATPLPAVAPLQPRPIPVPPAGVEKLPSFPVAKPERAHSHPAPPPVARQAPAVKAVHEEKPAPITAEKPLASPTPAAGQEPPSLNVSGIGWQKDSADRLAVVNGRAVSEGSVIAGAKVEEIFPDRVRFSFGERKIDVPLGKTPGESR